MAHFESLGFEVTNTYGDGVVRMGLRASDRAELVAWIGANGDGGDVQVWLDGAPQDVERIVAGIHSKAAAMLAEFHDHPNALPETTNTQALRRTLHEEEHAELMRELEEAAAGRADLDQIAREIADVLYVTYGTAWAFGINADAALREVHRAAMDKMRAGIRRDDGKILKPPGFRPPSMSQAITNAAAT